jgi:DNA-binding response OmpR family regulator
MTLNGTLCEARPATQFAWETDSRVCARVLVADDDEDLRDMLAITLNLAGYEVITAADGHEALALIHSRLPDVVVLDVVMPFTTGFEICRRLREKPATAGVRVILLTGKTGREAIDAGMDAGANAFLVKPVSLHLLLDEVRAALLSE